MNFEGFFKSAVLGIVFTALIPTAAFAEKTRDLEKAVSEGRAITTSGLVLLLGGTALQYIAIPVAIGGNVDGAVGVSVTGLALQITGPLLVSGGATHVERVSGLIGNNWQYYKAGLILQLVGMVSNLIPWRIVVYENTENYGYSYRTTQVTISPAPLILGFVSQVMYIVNTANAYSYISNANSAPIQESRSPRVIPQLSFSNGVYSAGLVFPF
jgi:hypothetical protein